MPIKKIERQKIMLNQTIIIVKMQCFKRIIDLANFVVLFSACIRNFIYENQAHTDRTQNKTLFRFEMH